MKAPWNGIFLLVVAIGTGALGCSSGDQSTAAAKGADAGPAADGGDLSVTLVNGPVQGDLVGGSRRFLKIPYAKPPIGDLRWKAPVKSDPWTVARHETSMSLPCPQTASSQGAMSTNEDCLYLNVWAPEAAPAKAPVMIWIHGGGNFAGSAADLVPTTAQLWYDGQFFASKRGVVVVTANYRLGPFGFFAHPDLAGESGLAIAYWTTVIAAALVTFRRTTAAPAYEIRLRAAFLAFSGGSRVYGDAVPVAAATGADGLPRRTTETPIGIGALPGVTGRKAAADLAWLTAILRD